MFLKKIGNYKNILFIIILIQATLIWLHMDKKEVLSVDEVYTYSLSNSPYGMLFPSIIIKPINNYDIWNKWIPGKVFKDYLTVSPGNEFNYSEVYKNQTQDTHPPFYFCLIHTICSFFPGKFSKWFGLGLNLFIFVISQIVLFIVSKTILKSEKYAFLVCLFYGFSKASVDNYTYISFNALLTLFNLLLLNFFIKALDNKISFKRFLEFFLIVLFGGFTHYLFLFFTIIITIIFSIISFYRKNYYSLFSIISFTFVSVLTLYLMFPQMIIQLNNAYMAGEIANDSKQFFSGIGFIPYFIRKFFCITEPYLFWFSNMFITFLYSFVSWKLIDKYFKNKSKLNILVTIIPLITVFIILSFYMNYYFFYKSYIKYFFSYYPIVSIVLLLILKQFNKKYLLVFTIVFISILPSYSYLLNNYNRIDKKEFSIDNVFRDNNVFFVFNDYQDIQLLAPYLSLSNNVLLTKINSEDFKVNNIPQSPSTGKNYMVITNKLKYNGKKYSLLFSQNISSEKVYIYEITN